MSENRLNAYRIMWLFVFFDLPVMTKPERHTATHFRKFLEKLKSSLLSARAERKLLCVRFSQYNRPVR